MKRRLLSIILAVLSIAASFSISVLAAPSAEPPGIPEIDAINAATNPVLLTPGRTAVVSISAHFTAAVTDYGAYNGLADDLKAQVRVVGFSQSGLYLSNANLLTPQPLRTIETAGSATGWAKIEYPVTLTSLYSGSSVSLTVEISYNGGVETQEFTFPVDNRQPEQPVFPDPDPLPPPDPTVASISVTPRSVTIRAGQSNSIAVEVVNSGEKAANNLSATLTPAGELQSLLPANPPSAFTASINTIRRAGSASQGNRGTFTYTISAPETLRSGVYEFRVNGSFYHETSNNLGVFDGSVQVVVINDFEPVSMQITDVGPLFPVRSGDLFNINIQVRNTGGLPARDAVVSVKNPSETSFTVMGSSAAGLIGTVGAGQTGNRTLTLRAAQVMQPGAYPLVILLSYTDSDNQPQTTEYETVVEVTGVPAGELEMIRATVPGGTLRPGQRTVMTIELRNPGAAAADNVRVRVSGFTGAGLYLANGESNLPSKTIGSIPAGERASVTWDVVLSDVCNSPSLALQAEIIHTLPDGSLSSITENISFAVILPDPAEPPSESPSSVPKLIIDRYTISWEDQPIQTLRAGAMFDLTFTLRNTSSLTELSNITVTLSSTDGIFMPAAGSNTFFIDSVEIGGEIERTVRLIVAQNAETKSYQLNFSLDYEDKNGVAYRPGESLSLPVVVPLIVELANFNPPMWGDMGMQTYMMFQYINKGKGTVYNFTIDIEGDFMMPDGSSAYIGNLASGYTDYFECMMIPIAAGELQCAVVLRFEDAVGNPTEMRQEFVMTVNEPFYPDFPEGDFPGFDPWDPGFEDGGGFLFGLSLPVVAAIGGGVIVVAAVTIILVRRKKIKKRKLLEEEEYDEAL